MRPGQTQPRLHRSLVPQRRRHPPIRSLVQPPSCPDPSYETRAMARRCRTAAPLGESNRQPRNNDTGTPHAALGLKNVESFAMPLVLAFFNFSTLIEAVLRFFPFTFSVETEPLLSLISTLAMLAAACADISSCMYLRCTSKAVKLCL